MFTGKEEAYRMTTFSEKIAATLLVEMLIFFALIWFEKWFNRQYSKKVWYYTTLVDIIPDNEPINLFYRGKSISIYRGWFMYKKNLH